MIKSKEARHALNTTSLALLMRQSFCPPLFKVFHNSLSTGSFTLHKICDFTYDSFFEVR